MLDRRRFLASSAAIAATTLLHRSASRLLADEPPAAGSLNLRGRIPQSVAIASAELLHGGGQYFVRVRSKDGAEGIAVAGERMEYLWPILTLRVLPLFVGQDAREIERLVDDCYRQQSNYKLAGLPLWICVAAVEMAVFDMLGKIADRSVGELLGGVRRKEIPVYLSSLRRDTTPQQEVDWLGKRLAETGAQAVKIKIGGRMSNNADAAPGRTDQLVPLARKTFGDSCTIQVDANSSYDAAKAIEVGRMLEAHGVYFYEEPCPWEDFEATKRVADALTKVLVAGGEQDTSYDKFRWLVRERGVDIVQPDVLYNGGFVRTLRVARLAAEAGIDITPHSPQPGFTPCYMLHFASVVPNLGKFQEFRGEASKPQSWFSPNFEVKNGHLTVPTGPGLGMTIDPAMLAKAKAM